MRSLVVATALRIAAVFAILIAVIALTASSAEAQVPLNSEEARLVLQDSQNAHMVAKLTLDTISCIMTTLENEVDWTPTDCLASLRTRLAPLGLEHRDLHPRVTRLIEGKLIQRKS